MNKAILTFIGMLAGISFLFSSACRAKHTTPTTTIHPPVVENKAVSIPSYSPDSLSKALFAADVPLKWFSAKVSANTDIDKQSNSFSANLRIKRDSAIWMSISPALGIEVARAYITPDSLKFINRIDGTYFKGDYRYLNELLQIEVNFKMVQSILLGNAYLHYSVENYISDRENADLVLSTLKKRRIRRENELDIPQILTQEIWFSSLKNKIIRMEMQDYRPVRKFGVNYLDFEQVEEWLLPNRFSITAQAAKTVKIDLEYSRMTVNKELNLPFNIPDNYEPSR
ncbi:MAG: hypothetical protein RLZZ543_1567 [Bacteroidota bacterium]